MTLRVIAKAVQDWIAAVGAKTARASAAPTRRQPVTTLSGYIELKKT